MYWLEITVEFRHTTTLFIQPPHYYDHYFVPEQTESPITSLFYDPVTDHTIVMTNLHGVMVLVLQGSSVQETSAKCRTHVSLTKDFLSFVLFCCFLCFQRKVKLNQRNFCE